MLQAFEEMEVNERAQFFPEAAFTPGHFTADLIGYITQFCHLMKRESQQS